MKDITLNEILHGIITAKKELETANQNFNFATTEELVDIYTYQIIAAKRKYDFLIRQARENNIYHSDYLSREVRRAVI